MSTLSIGEQVIARTKRVRRANFVQDTQGKCLGCGEPFQQCGHTMTEINRLIEAVQWMDFFSKA